MLPLIALIGKGKYAKKYAKFMPIQNIENTGFQWCLPIQYLKGFGPRRAILFKKLGVETIEDLLYFIPYRYEDRTVLKKIGHLQVGEDQTILAEIKTVSLIETPRKRMKIVTIAASDETGIIHAKWFNQPYMKEVFKKGEQVMLSGKVRENLYGGYGLEMENPQYEKMEKDEPSLHMGCIVPIYHETKGLTSRQIRSLMRQTLDQYAFRIPEILPGSVISNHHLSPLREAIVEIHFPSKGADLSLLNSGKSLAHHRLCFDEFFLLQIGLAIRKRNATEKKIGIAFTTTGPLTQQLRTLLPFKLTDAQERVLSEIKKDMASPYPMNRLLQGDVGSGKTLVALMAILIAIENGYQAALMAPTEILAGQHYLSLMDYLKTLGKTVALLTSDMKKREKDDILRKVESGKTDLVIGTHALIQKDVRFRKLGLAVVDEQHKFGVLQRAELIQKGYRPDILIMTATPIPRTLALTLYGDLNLSTIDALPPGRSPIQTSLFYEKQRKQIYQLLENELAKGRQAYVVCPLVEESEKIDLKAAVTMSTLLKETFPNRRIDLIHGRLKREEKTAIMDRLKKGLIDLLVATTVVEVGIDVPNATVMLIEHVERLGLAQLHQLRGRVGRGAEKSYCFLIAGYPISQDGKRRLEAMVKSNDGFYLSEVDLKIRGPGDFFGTRQSGIPELKVASLVRDAAILESARQEAFEWIQRDPALSNQESLPIRSSMERKWKAEWACLQTE